MLEKGKFTFAMIKPVAVQRGNIGGIIQMIEDKGFRVAALKKTALSKDLAKQFYSEHEGKSFFEELVDFMCSGPVVAMVLEKENAVKDYRNLIGATDPKNAIEGTIRKKFAETLRSNAVHGSDADASALRETNLVFSQADIY